MGPSAHTLQAGNNSRPGLVNTTSFHYGVWMNETAYGVENMLIVPRFSVPQPGNVATPDAMMEVRDWGRL